MEEMILKYAEFGVLSAITMLLLMRGLNTLNDLSKSNALLADSQKVLAETVSKLADKVSAMDTKIENVSYKLGAIEKHLDKIDDILRTKLLKTDKTEIMGV